MIQSAINIFQEFVMYVVGLLIVLQGVVLPDDSIITISISIGVALFFGIELIRKKFSLKREHLFIHKILWIVMAIAVVIKFLVMFIF